VVGRIDFAAKDVAQAIGDWCEHLASHYVLLNAAEAAATAREMLQRFAASKRAKQLAQASAIHRELEFVLAWPPNHLHGYIDCLYQDAEGRWHVLDYKTTKSSTADIARLAKQYEMQMYVYALAAERALGQPPAELALHFLRPGVEHVFLWNDLARRQAIDMVNNAIAQYQGSKFAVQDSMATIHRTSVTEP
ncbi:MAG TPA: PD-(D/E)XK nuclease family protein, partial [Lacipirellulaceae bacterium]|nr:PD-(D/E)XK nuclease family protein [Lacipirellulaceae bacterium]